VHVGFWWKKPEERRPIGKPRRKLEDNIKMDFKYVRWRYELDESGLG
jgi:hypothetical protein